ncbi:sigma-70 family RNA polymerase sigma factor [Streptomyces sp. N35]|uniref:sigma-70 family RNA polymerase sigma factor n=1 Tax=Streptomyces sp. N35 TaxID=2795730 RepID=UPI0018F2CA62|nr:sigma-70 family RNA polymerase sigma factor [Streptomyces sp. N35]
MTTSSPEHSTHTTGAHRAHRRAHRADRTVSHHPPTRYEPYLDGLFTYCLSVLCDHEAATGALGDVLALAERRTGRGPVSHRDRRAWLYALARWACLRRLAEAKRKRQGAHAGGRDAGETAAAAQPQEHTRQLALLAWPEAAGTTPEQREALELAVRHRLGAGEVADVLGMERTAARELISAAACEVERTRAALAVVETGTCPIVARLTGDSQLLLGAALRGELVRHVDDCPRCRRTAERAGAKSWPGTEATPAGLPVVEAPRAALHAAMASAVRARGGAPRFDRRGFPMDPKDRAARRDRLRARAVTTTVVATVVAAPVLALWAAYRGAPLTGEGDGRSVSASEAGGPGGLDGENAEDTYENAGNAHAEPDPRFTAGSHSPDVSVEVISPGAAPTAPGIGPGRLTVDAQPHGDTTLITLTASGGRPVHWSAYSDASWLYFSHTSGTLNPGESLTIQVWVDHSRQPAGHWTARIAVDPGNAVVVIDGYGAGSPGPGPSDPGPSDPGPSDPGPSDPGPSDPGPSDPGPSDPGPSDPGPSDPGPSDPGPSDPGPSDPGPSDPPPTTDPTPSDPPPSDTTGPSPTG